MPSHTRRHHRSRRWSGAARRALTRAAALTSVLCVMLVAVSGFGATSALANSYTALLSASAGSEQGASNNSGGFVYSEQSWSAPNGMQFGGFAYTAAAFWSNAGSLGGISAGFMGTGGSAPAILMFPWTDDCSITHSGHDWANGSGTAANDDCNTSGNTSGWNFTNSELEAADPSTNPQTPYSTLTLEAFCQEAECDAGEDYEDKVTNLSGDIDDPNNQPTGSGSWTTSTTGSSWYQTDTNAPALDVSANDPAGVCAIGVQWDGPASYYSQVTDENPGMEDVGGAIGNEFDGIQPCGTGSASGTASMPAGIASGTYSLAVLASNPGNWEGGAGLSNAPTIASYGSAINVDDTTPSGTWVRAPSGWTSSTAETLDVTVGPSGLSSVSCSDNGSNVAPTLIYGSTSGAGTTAWSVPTTITGANAVSCSLANGDANGALTGTEMGTFDVDTAVPVVTFADNGYTGGTWTNASQTVTVSATGGPSGIKTISCLADSNSAPLSGPASNQVTISGNGQHVLDCTATSNTNVTGQATYDVWIDTRQPTVSFSGAQAAPAWLSGTPTVVVTGGENGGSLSGITKVLCSVNGGSPLTVNVYAAQNYTTSFVLTANGADVVSCQATDAAGTTGPAYTETVNVDNPNAAAASVSLTQYGSSPDIDNGTDPFTDGPSETTWSRTPQSVTITANDTGGGAGIASISCTGAELGGGTTGTWPIDNLNTDPQGGEQIKVTVQPPGGELACTATDTAGNVYALGSYEFEIDDTAPAGVFVSQSAWPEPADIELHVTDSGSGVQFVRVYAQPNDGGKAIDLGFAQYDPTIRDYVVEVDDGAIAPGAYTFYANVADNAGNTGQITGSPEGGAEQLVLPLRRDTALTLQAQSVTGVQDAAAPSALAPALDAAVAGTSTAETRALVRDRFVTAVASSARAETHSKVAALLVVAYGKTVTLNGVLRDLEHGDRVIAHAKIYVYQEISGTSKISLVGKTTTNAHGRYSYRVKGGASRVVFALYPGTEKLRSAVSQLPEHFTGSVSLSTNAVRAGGTLLLNGAVAGGHIPAGGVNVTVHYCQVGLPGCGQFGTIRTNTKGQYSFKQYFTAATKGLRYKLWVTVPAGQPDWPYDGATSTKVVKLVT
jgi:hypothetical protein